MKTESVRKAIILSALIGNVLLWSVAWVTIGAGWPDGNVTIEFNKYGEHLIEATLVAPFGIGFSAFALFLYGKESL